MPTKTNPEKNSVLNGLHRSSTNKIIAGVAGGLGEYFDIDPTIIRIIFVLLTVFGGSGIIIYIILWLVMPQDQSISSTPKEHIRENMEDLKSSAEKFAHDIKLSGHREESKKWFGLIILTFGFLFLLNSLGVYSTFYFDRLWPLILIVIGLIIISRK